MNRRDFLQAIAAAPVVRVAGRGEGIAAGIVALGRRAKAWLERRRFVGAVQGIFSIIGPACDTWEALIGYEPERDEIARAAKFAEQMRGVLDELAMVCEAEGLQSGRLSPAIWENWGPHGFTGDLQITGDRRTNDES